LLATRFHDITHPDDLEPDLAHIDDLLAGNTHSFQMEKRYFRKDGSIVWVILSVSLLRDDSGAPLHFISQVQDISERKSVEVERAVTHQYTREVLERITDGFYALDRDWRFTYVNQTAERMLGRTREELQGQIIWEEFGPAEETPVYAAFHRAMADGITTSVDSYDAPLGAWFELRAYPSPNGLSIFFQDVTARRQLERQLRTSETKYRTLVEQIPAVVYVLAADQHQSPLYFSPRYQELTGFLPDEALLRTEHWLDHVHPEDRARVAANDALTLRQVARFEWSTGIFVAMAALSGFRTSAPLSVMRRGRSSPGKGCSWI
jgi:PAS domain S-box-containing protein